MNHAEEIWKTLVRATVDKKHPWRVVGFSTAGLQGPEVRSVILRGANPACKQLVFYTDRRSQKMTDIGHEPRVALLFWNPRSNTQLRASGTALAENDSANADSHWARIPEYSRKDYATLSAPGDFLQADSPAFDFETARRNFSVLNVKVNAMELLELKREGHSRQAFLLDDTGHWLEKKLVP